MMTSSIPYTHISTIRLMGTAATVIIAITVVCIILLIAGITLTFMSSRLACVTAYSGLLGIGLTVVNTSATPLIFWGISTAIVICLEYMLPKKITS
ncbi:MAG: hypothetical protein K2F76_06410, partial [Duncaniella dubosii]|nr:hypothetical protein [Duncaniella dubosii]